MSSYSRLNRSLGSGSRRGGGSHSGRAAAESSSNRFGNGSRGLGGSGEYDCLFI